MRLTKINTFDRYQGIVDRYGANGCRSNDYIQREVANLISHDALYEYCGDKNAFLMLKKDGFWRVYYYINDIEEKLILDSEDEFVTEILFRGNLGEPQEEISYLESCGFKRNLVRDQYFARYALLSTPLQASGVVVDIVTTIEEVKWAINLFNASFDKWSGDFIPADMAEPLLQEHSVLIAKDMKGNMLGALHRENKMGVTWLKHVAVVEHARGVGVGRALVDVFIEHGHTDDNSRYMLWVQKHNVPAVNLYQKKGFTYMNKSSLSMIKL